MALRDLLEALKTNAAFRNDLLQDFSEYSNRSLAASFVIAARKPAGWKESQLLKDTDRALAEESQLARKEYYELRMTAIERHHEIALYERLCREKGIELMTGSSDTPEPIHYLLARCKPDNILEPDSVLAANRALRELEQGLRASRDKWRSLLPKPLLPPSKKLLARP